MTKSALDRREALRRLGWGGLGVAATPLWAQALTALANDHAHALHHDGPAAVAADWTPKALTARQNDMVVALSEMILPETDTPGARAALVNRFIDAVLADADDHDRESFLDGLGWMDERSCELFGDDFMKVGAEQQAALLTILSSGRNKSLEDQAGVEFFETLKKLTVTGYYTSEAGMKELGQDGLMFFAGYDGCRHPEHGGKK